MALKASINVYKKLGNNQKLSADDLRALIYEFKDNVDKLEEDLKEHTDKSEDIKK